MSKTARLSLALIALSLRLNARAADSASPLTITLRDYLTMPITANPKGEGQSLANLARVNFLRDEPGVNRNRFFINDQNGLLYIVDKRTKAFTTYLDFNGRDGRKGIFHRFSFEVGYASGIVCFQFDPDYAHNGRFYTIHMEEPDLPAVPEPDNSSFPALRTAGFKTTEPVKTPGRVTRQAVLLEWTDTNPANSKFEGSVRELLRLQMTSQIHPLDDLVFNPTAHPGDADWRVMYLSCGDGGAGESPNLAVRYNPQRLDTLVGKILRIIPDLSIHKDSSKISDNGQYRVPNDNPFTERAGTRPEVWAYGLRNPHRMVWEVDPADPKNNYLIASVIGLHTWETVVIVHKGGNYGYPEREGNQQMTPPKNEMVPIPDDDRIPLRVTDQPSGELLKPLYPVIQYGHVQGGGDAIAGGYVYHGKIAALRGKFIMGDITTGRVWWADLKEMLADDGSADRKMAPLHEVRLLWQGSNGKGELYSSLAPIAAATYHKRGGTSDPLPGFAQVGNGRTDMRFAVDAAGELYIISKSDGMIREVTAAMQP